MSFQFETGVVLKVPRIEVFQGWLDHYPPPDMAYVLDRHIRNSMCEITGPSGGTIRTMWPQINPSFEDQVPGIPNCYKRTFAPSLLQLGFPTPTDYYRHVVTVAPQHRVHFEYLVNEGEIICKHVFHAHASVKKLAWLLKEHLEDNGRMSFRHNGEANDPFRMWRIYYGNHEVVTHYFMYGAILWPTRRKLLSSIGFG